jgi:uncharacterized protein
MSSSIDAALAPYVVKPDAVFVRTDARAGVRARPDDIDLVF